MTRTLPQTILVEPSPRVMTLLKQMAREVKPVGVDAIGNKGQHVYTYIFDVPLFDNGSASHVK